MTARLAMVALFVAAPLAAAQAQNGFGDTQLAYKNGVVYDDDLVPGVGMNSPFLVEEQAGSSSYQDYRRTDSPNLIGNDGRISNQIYQDADRAASRLGRRSYQD
ncbi:hypothetical protein [Acuticoccus mangrovi]|uniref:Uncharacterized protein n=1 Tax=Acuticoccus mangrovi TaxID=2796142 RepID=A0A934MCH3_9HYPH|nr:hypothetical protein [Acuticoccus mangrovi]MBJ3775272.1 hypothetical protein [Acuticoccus mangrovi]